MQNEEVWLLIEHLLVIDLVALASRLLKTTLQLFEELISELALRDQNGDETESIKKFPSFNLMQRHSHTLPLSFHYPAHITLPKTLSLKYRHTHRQIQALANYCVCLFLTPNMTYMPHSHSTTHTWHPYICSRTRTRTHKHALQQKQRWKKFGCEITNHNICKKSFDMRWA